MQRLSIGSVLSEAWDLYTRNALRLIAMAAVVFAFLSLVTAIVVSLDVSIALTLALVLGVSIVGVLWLQGAIVAYVGDLRAGAVSVSVGEVFRRVQPKVGALVAAGVISAAVVAVLLALAVYFLPAILLVAVAVTYLSVVVPAIVIEGKNPAAAFPRSVELVRGNLLRALIIVVLSVLFSTIVSRAIGALLEPLPGFFDYYVSGVVANAVTVPLVALTWTVMYFELRYGR
jgi:hypothetical protein